MRIGMKIVGLERTLRKLASIPGAMNEAAASDIQGQTQEIAEIAKVLAPHEEGDLERGIQAKPVVQRGDRTEGRVESAAKHSIHVEYGTSEQDPQPFLRPATLTNGPDRIARLGRVAANAAEAV